MLRLSGLSLPLDHPPEAIAPAICARLGIAADELRGFTLFTERLEAACARALAHDSPHYRTVKTILSTKADLQGAQADSHTPPAYAGTHRFTRPAAELFPTPQPSTLH